MNFWPRFSLAPKVQDHQPETHLIPLVLQAGVFLCVFCRYSANPGFTSGPGSWVYAKSLQVVLVWGWAFSGVHGATLRTGS